MLDVLGVAMFRFVIYTMLLGLCKGELLCDDFSCFFGGVCNFTSPTDSHCACPEMTCNSGMPDVEVCGDDDVTYANYCDLERRRCLTQRTIYIQSVGACEAVGTCTTKYDCMPNAECLRGECICIECPDVSARRVYYNGRPGHGRTSRLVKRSSVCGTDGVTYASPCHLRYVACKKEIPLEILRRGVCRHDRRSVATSGRALTDVELLDTRVSSRSNIQLVNCSIIKFNHCVSRRHPRLYYMGEYEITGQTHLNASVYALRTPGSVNPSSESQLFDYPVFLSRFKASRQKPGGWLVGSKIGSRKGWLGVSDPALNPKDVTGKWRSTTKGSQRSWRAEPTISVECKKLNEETEPACEDHFNLNLPLKSNWQRSYPRKPIYVLKFIRVTKKGNYRPRRKFTLQISTTSKWRRFSAYQIKITTERDSCGVPMLADRKSKSTHTQHCGGKVLFHKNKSKKMLRQKIRFKAPFDGCVWFRVSVVSVKRFMYEDDNLVRKICAKHR
nr:uncharacterized protein LOC100185894 [Ciona intestinalis]|eukprot:XP_002124417.3 uncharacterized protein LOC100185894 [Ciona intestinalis]